MVIWCSLFSGLMETGEDEACEVLILVLAVLIAQAAQRPRRRWRWWVRPINEVRHNQGHFFTLFQEIKAGDHDQFFIYTRMLPDQYDALLALLRFRLTKHSIRRPISQDQRLAMTLK